MKFSKIHILVFIAAFILTISLTWIFLPSNENKDNMYFLQSYNFRKLRLDNSDIDILKIGAKLDVINIKNTQGKSLSFFSDKKLCLFVTTDPDCPACNFSKDMMENIRITTESINIAYYPILAPSISPGTNMKKYSKSFGFDDYFYWSSELPLTDSLRQIMTPTHILIDRNRTIIQVWYGTDKNEEIRKRMSNQISADLLTINDVYEAIPINKFPN